MKTDNWHELFTGLHRSVPAEFARVQEGNWVAEAGDITDGQPPFNTQRRKRKVNKSATYLEFWRLACVDCAAKKRQRPYAEVADWAEAREGVDVIIDYALLIADCRARRHGWNVMSATYTFW